MSLSVLAVHQASRAHQFMTEKRISARFGRARRNNDCGLQASAYSRRTHAFTSTIRRELDPGSRS